MQMSGGHLRPPVQYDSLRAAFGGYSLAQRLRALETGGNNNVTSPFGVAASAGPFKVFFELVKHRFPVFGIFGIKAHPDLRLRHLGSGQLRQFIQSEVAAFCGL